MFGHENLLYLIIVSIISYLIGSLSSSIIIGKAYGIDIRQYGSGNAGTTNSLRVLGKKAGVFVLIIDILKGVIAVLIGKFVAKDAGGSLAMVFVMIGHNWPVFFGFRGGKGVATSLGAILTMAPLSGVILLAIGVPIIIITRYISLASLCAAVLFPISIWFINPNIIVPAIIMPVIVIYKHRSNIKRLLNGTESKIGQKVTIQ